MVSAPLQETALASAGLRRELERSRVLAIVRGREPEAALASIEVLVEAGIRMIEVSLTGVNALGVLHRAVESCPGDALIGAGTVRSVADLDAVLDAGARFAVAPALTPAVAEAARSGIPALPGVLTPGEIEEATKAGWAVLKLFPASLGGPAYLRALLDPYPGVSLVPVGGVTLEMVPAYFEAGALAVGIGSPLLGDAPHGGDLHKLRRRAEQLLSTLAALAAPMTERPSETGEATV